MIIITSPLKTTADSIPAFHGQTEKATTSPITNNTNNHPINLVQDNEVSLININNQTKPKIQSSYIKMIEMTDMSPRKEPKEWTLPITAKKNKTNIRQTPKKDTVVKRQEMTIEMYNLKNDFNNIHNKMTIFAEENKKLKDDLIKAHNSS